MVDGGHHTLQPLTGLPHTVSFVSDCGDALATLKAIYEIIEQRKAAGMDFVRGRVLLVVDEFANLAAALHRIYGLDEKKEFLSYLASITADGRKWGVHCVVGTQKALADTLGPLAKSNMAFRVVGLAADKNDANTNSGRAGSGAERLSGDGDFLLIHATSVVRFQVPWINAPLKLALDITRKWSGVRPVVKTTFVAPTIPQQEERRTVKMPVTKVANERPVISYEASLLLPAILSLWDSDKNDFFYGKLKVAIELLQVPNSPYYRIKAKEFALEAFEAYRI